MPRISMDPKVHYVTQSSCFSSPLRGPLTDRRIAKYQKLGWYGPNGKVKPEKRKRKSESNKILAKLTGKYT